MNSELSTAPGGGILNNRADLKLRSKVCTGVSDVYVGQTYLWTYEAGFRVMEMKFPGREEKIQNRSMDQGQENMKTDNRKQTAVSDGRRCFLL